VTFYTELIKRLKNGSIKNVLLFGDGMENVAVPYVVVKPIAGGDRELLQIFTHVNIGMMDIVKSYVLKELTELLKKPIEYDSGKSVTARSTGAWMGPYVDEGDNTLAMSRDFYIPLII
jgi:hypothetical protein